MTPTQLGGDDAALQILGPGHRRFVGHRQHPPRRIAGLLAVGQLADLLDVAAVLLDPVEAGDARVEHAVPDVAAHLLGPQVDGLDLLVVDRRPVAALRLADVQAGLVKQIHRRFLQTSGGKAQFQNSFRSHVYSLCTKSTSSSGPVLVVARLSTLPPSLLPSCGPARPFGFFLASFGDSLSRRRRA